MITKIEFNSPGAAAGLKRGDILLEIDGKSCRSATQFLKLAASQVPCTVVRLWVLREGKLRAGSAKLGVRPRQPKAAAIPTKPEPAFHSHFICVNWIILDIGP